MASRTVILKNNTAGDFSIVGIFLDVSPAQIDVSDENPGDLIADENLLPQVDLGNIIVNDGTSDLSEVIGRRYLENSGIASTLTSTTITSITVFDDVSGTLVTEAPATIDSTTSELRLSGEISGFTGIKPPAVSGDITLTLPDSIVDGGVLSTDAGGVLGWTTFTSPAIMDSNLSTSLLDGGQLSINGDDTKFDISAGTGLVVDSTTDPNVPVVTEVSWSAFSAQSTPFLTSDLITFVSIDSAGAIVTSDTFPDSVERRTDIFLGLLVHSNLTNITFVNQLPTPAIDGLNQLRDLAEGLGFFNIEGNIISSNGANLKINKSSGTGFRMGANYQANNANPHNISLVASSPTTFKYRQANSTEFSDVTDIDPLNYDNAGVLTAVPSGNWTIQRFFVFPSGAVRAQYGQFLYTRKANALKAISSEAFNLEQNIDDNAMLIGIIVVERDAVDLSDSDEAVILNPGRFNDVTGIGIGSVDEPVVQEDDVEVSGEVETFNFTGDVAVTDDGNNKVTIDISPGLGGLIDLSAETIVGGDSITSEAMLFVIDSSRGDKVLSSEAFNFTFATNIVNNDTWMPASHVSDADSGLILPYDATLIRATGHCTDTTSNSHDFSMWVNNVDTVTNLGLLTGGANVSIVNSDLNIDISAGDKVRVRAKSTGGKINDTILTLWFKWRFIP